MPKLIQVVINENITTYTQCLLPTIGVFFIAPSGKTFKYSFLLSFECTNNIAKYEALMLGLNLAIKHGIKLLSAFGDS